MPVLMPVTREQLAERVSAIEGLTAEERSALLTMLRERKRYGLVWEDKAEKAEADMQESLPVLTEVPERAIISPHADAPNHILIEGDNLHALTTLCYTHEGRIDVIYIDPPYNTGNKDFVYNDDFSEGKATYVGRDDGFRHSKWLSFMARRLRLAKQLLSDRGVIFISIDDNEVAQLKMLCDDVFGEKNGIAIMPRITKKSGKDHSEFIAQNNDYLLAYARNVDNVSFNGFDVDVDGYNNTDEYVVQRGKYKLNQTLDYNSLWYNPTMDFPLVVGDKTYYPGGDINGHNLRHNGIHNPKDWVWRWSQAKFDFGYANGFVVIKKGKGRPRIYTKTYLNAAIEKNDEGYYIKYTERKTKLSSLAFVDNDYSNDKAKKDMAEVIDGNAFDFPKPCSLISVLLTLVPSSDVTILDFFAGSGTTLHATMELNKDGCKRQCILVQSDENSICERVTYERNRRVIQGYTTPKGVEVQGLEHNTLRYYRTDFVEREPSPRNMRRLMAMATDMLCIKHDIYTEEPVICGRRLRRSAARHFTRSDKRMLVIYDEQAIVPIVELLSKEDDSRGLIVYVFAPDSYAYDELFDSIRQRVTLCALPAAIYRVYRRILGRRKPKSQTTEPFIHD